MIDSLKFSLISILAKPNRSVCHTQTEFIAQQRIGSRAAGKQTTAHIPIIIDRYRSISPFCYIQFLNELVREPSSAFIVDSC